MMASIEPHMPGRALRTAAAALAALALAVCAAAPAAGGPTAKPSVMGGGPADRVQFAFAAAILQDGRFACSGSVVSPRHVLTAGHCARVPASKIQVVTGRYDMRKPSTGQTFRVIAKAIHPGYKRSQSHDLAVLTLAAATPAPSIAVATTEQGRIAARRGQGMTVAGWGATTPFHDRASGILKTTTVIGTGKRPCHRRYGKAFRGKSMICARGPKLNPRKKQSLRTSPCAGDSGGPLLGTTPQGQRLVGAVSFGPRLCGLPFVPVAYAKTFDASALAFIGGAMFAPLP